MTLSDNDYRPDPDALLADIDREQRGGLKVFLGAAPGVGKTYAMLLAAREAQREGRHVAIGVVESHGRAETEHLCDGLEPIPLQDVPHRGRTFAEFDLDTALARRPEIVLMDELAHRNIPGTRHPRRYQDIEELIGEGIEVWTTLNVQHLESLNDRVARISGVRMRETVPDELLEKARDVVLIDLAPQELIERLKQGKVYVPEQVRGALDGFFNASNLTALREMAFVAATNRVDADLREAMQRRGRAGPWPARERVVIAVDGRRNAHQAVRAGKRIAARRRAPWTVVYVDTGRPRPPAAQEAIDRAFQLAERLGGQTAILRGPDVEDEILAYARDQNASAIVIAQTRGRPFAGWFRQTLTQRLLRRNTDFEITIVGAKQKQPAPPKRRWLRWFGPAWRAPWRHYLFAGFVTSLAVVVSAVMDYLLPLPVLNFSLVFLTGVLIVAARTSLPVALATAAVSSLAFNFFFIAPRLTLTIYRTGEVITVLFFLVVAVVGGNLANRLRAQVAALRATNEQSQALLALSKRLAGAPDPIAVRRIAVESIAAFGRAPACLLTQHTNRDGLRVAASSPQPVKLGDKERAAAAWALQRGHPSGFHSNTLASVKWRFLPLTLEGSCYGVLGVKLAQLSTPPRSEQLLMLDALATQVTLTLARTELTASLQQARVAEETERLRSALLSSVSHDLRTPLASMIGSASTLRDLAGQLTHSDRRELLDAVLSEGHRLNRYIDNLLDMTRLGHGKFTVERDWVTLTDIVAAALRRTRELVANLRVARDIPADLPLLYVQPALIEQALVNIIENAARFSPPNGEIRIRGQRHHEQLLITVTDQGPGIAEADRKRVFDMFFSCEGGDTERHGSGLGLAICHGMVKAHGGSIQALAGSGERGTTIAIHLPLHALPQSGEDDDVDGDG